MLIHSNILIEHLHHTMHDFFQASVYSYYACIFNGTFSKNPCENWMVSSRDTSSWKFCKTKEMFCKAKEMWVFWSAISQNQNLQVQSHFAWLPHKWCYHAFMLIANFVNRERIQPRNRHSRNHRLRVQAEEAVGLVHLWEVRMEATKSQKIHYQGQQINWNPLMVRIMRDYDFSHSELNGNCKSRFFE